MERGGVEAGADWRLKSAGGLDAETIARATAQGGREELLREKRLKEERDRLREASGGENQAKRGMRKGL